MINAHPFSSYARFHSPCLHQHNFSRLPPLLAKKRHKAKIMNSPIEASQTIRLKVPEHAFKSCPQLMFNPEYRHLLKRFVTISGQHRKSFNHRFYAGALPLGIVCGFAAKTAFILASAALTGKTPSILADLSATLAGNLVGICAGYFLFGVYKQSKILTSIDKPICVINDFHDHWRNGPVPQNVKEAVRTLEKIEDELTQTPPKRKWGFSFPPFRQHTP